MNWTLIIITLTLANPFNIGIANTAMNGIVNSQFNELQLQTEGKLEAKFTASATTGEIPLAVTFDASASTGDGELTYEWWFGNGATATGERVSFVYEDSGEYAAILVVSDGTSESSATQLIVPTNDKEPNTIQLPFTIDTTEVGDNGQYIVRGLFPTNIQHVDTAPIFNTRQGNITFLSLVDAEYKEIAQEVVLPNVKENIHFNANNSVSAFALYALSVNQVPRDDLIAIYPLLEQHPMFAEAVNRLRMLQGMRLVDIDANDPSILKFIADMSFEVARQYFIDNGTVTPNQLNPVKPEKPSGEGLNNIDPVCTKLIVSAYSPKRASRVRIVSLDKEDIIVQEAKNNQPTTMLLNTGRMSVFSFHQSKRTKHADFTDVQTQAEKQPTRVVGTLQPGGSFKGPDGVEVIAPEGALDEPVELFIERVDNPTIEHPIITLGEREVEILSPFYKIGGVGQRIQVRGYGELDIDITIPYPEGMTFGDVEMLKLVKAGIAITHAVYPDRLEWFFVFDADQQTVPGKYSGGVFTLYPDEDAAIYALARVARSGLP